MLRRTLAIFCLTAALLAAVGPGFAAQQAQPIAPQYPVPDYVNALLDVARQELGYQEVGESTKYGQWAGNPQAAWCAEFLCWSVQQVDEKLGTKLLRNQYPLYGGTNTGRDWFIRQGRYVARSGFITDWGTQWYIGQREQMAKNSYIPQPGDWMFLSFSPSGDTAHVAMVEAALRRDDGSVGVQVIEGNNPDRVQRAVYDLTDWRIQGYGTVHDVADMVLRMGAEGRKVQALQEKLITVALLAPDGATARYSQATADAVKALQSMQGMAPTGIANRETQLALDAYVAQWLNEHAGAWTVDGTR